MPPDPLSERASCAVLEFGINKHVCAYFIEFLEMFRASYIIFSPSAHAQ